LKATPVLDFDVGQHESAITKVAIKQFCRFFSIEIESDGSSHIVDPDLFVEQALWSVRGQ
jgi:hypothetical protein